MKKKVFVLSLFLAGIFVLLTLLLTVSVDAVLSGHACYDGIGFRVYQKELPGCSDIDCTKCGTATGSPCTGGTPAPTYYDCKTSEWDCNYLNIAEIKPEDFECKTSGKYAEVYMGKSSMTTLVPVEKIKGYYVTYPDVCIQGARFFERWDTNFKKCVELVDGKEIYHGFLIGTECSTDTDIVSVSDKEFGQTAIKYQRCSGWCPPPHVFSCSSPGSPVTETGCQEEGEVCYAGWNDVNKNGNTEETKGKCLGDSRCIVPVIIKDVKLELDKERLRSISNNYINIDEYDETVSIMVDEKDPNNPDDNEIKTFSIATIKDDLICNVSVAIPPYYVADSINDPNPVPGIPSEHPALEHMFIDLSYQLSEDGKNYQRRETNYELNIKRDCDIDDRTSTAYCAKTIWAVSYEGLSVKCSAKSVEASVYINSSEFVIAKYNYYFAPFNVGYGDIEEQYAYYANLADVNDKVPFVGKKILLNRRDLDLSKECCEKGLLFKEYFWTLNNTCKSVFKGKVVSDETKCENAGEKAYYYYSRGLFALLKDSVEKSLGGALIQDSIITVILPKRVAYEICNLEDGDRSMACTNFKDGALVIYSDFAGSRDSVIAHEFGHRIRKACDEYNLKIWVKSKRELGLDGCPNPVGEDTKIHFPVCCKKTGGPCGDTDSCIGMPYKTMIRGAGEDPFDYSVKSRDEIKYKSIMGDDRVEKNAYPKKSVCPLRNCY